MRKSPLCNPHETTDSSNHHEQMKVWGAKLTRSFTTASGCHHLNPWSALASLKVDNHTLRVLKWCKMNHRAPLRSILASPHTQEVETESRRASRANKERKRQIQNVGTFIGQPTPCPWWGWNWRGRGGCKRRAAGYRLKHFRNITTKCNGPSLCADWNKASVKDILKIFQKILSQMGLFNDTQELSLILLSVTMVLW